MGIMTNMLGVGSKKLKIRFITSHEEDFDRMYTGFHCYVKCVEDEDLGMESFSEYTTCARLKHPHNCVFPSIGNSHYNNRESYRSHYDDKIRTHGIHSSKVCGQGAP
jgi:hypothetical protein